MGISPKPLGATREVSNTSMTPVNKGANPAPPLSNSPSNKNSGDRFDGDLPTGQRALTNQTAENSPGVANPPPALGANSPPDSPEALRYFPELKDATPEQLQDVFKAIEKMSSGSLPEKLQGLSTLFKTFPDTLSNVLKDLGIQDNKLVKLATDKNALKSLSTLSNPQASNLDKVQAGLQLAASVDKLLNSEEASELLKSTSGLAPKLADAIIAWKDSDKGALEKGQATLELANALKSSLGSQFPQLAADLRFLDGPLKAVGGALTLLDPKATPEDKLLAAAQVAAEIPGLSGDLQSFVDALRQWGVDKPTLETISQNLKGFDALAEKLGAKELNKVLSGLVDKPEAMSALVQQLSGMDVADAKRLLKSVETLRPDVLAKVLGDAELLEGFGKMVKTLDGDAAKVFGKLVADMDDDMLRSLSKLTQGASPELLNKTVKELGSLLESVDGKVLGQALKLLDNTFSKMGVAISKEVSEKLLKNLAKIIPIAGVVPNAIDAAKYGALSAELRDQNPDLAAFAMVGAKLNIADGAIGVLGTLLDATGVGAPVGVAGDLALSVVFAGAELALDIAFEQELAKFKADPQNYQAPDWMKLVNLVGNDPISLAIIYGPEGAAQLAQWGIEKGAQGAIALAETIGTEAANLAGKGLEMSADLLHGLADVVRNPEKYATAVLSGARDMFNSALETGGALAAEAKSVVGNLIEEAKAMGQQGLNMLKFFAQNPDQLGKLALKGIGELTSQAMEAGKNLYQSGVQLLGELKETWGKAVGEGVSEALGELKSTVDSLVDKAVSLGKRGLDALAWIANNPSEAMGKAREALGTFLAKGGEVAQNAWDAIKGLGSKGLELAESAIKGLRNAGASAVSTLRYIADNPGEAAQKVRDWVGQTLSDAVRQGGAMAHDAAVAIKDFVDRRAEWAYGFAKNLLTDSVEAFTNVLGSWKTNLTKGAGEVLAGLEDLGEAGKEALEKLGKKIGGQVDQVADYLTNRAREGAQNLINWGSSVVDYFI